MSGEKTAPAASPQWRLYSGFLSVVLANALTVLLCSGLFSRFGGSDRAYFLARTTVAYLPFFQLIYVIPVAVWARKKPRFLKGVILGASFTFLIYGACWAILVKVGAK